MSRRSALSDIEQEQLCIIPNSRRDMERLYPFSEPDLSLIRQRRRAENRLGFAVQLCLLRYLSRPLTIGREVPATLVQWVAEQIQSKWGSGPAPSTEVEGLACNNFRISTCFVR